jgi:hypothetical protein
MDVPDPFLAIENSGGNRNGLGANLLSLFESGFLVAGVGFEPTTFGL